MLKILFVCTHNRCRSITAEAVARQIGQGLLDVRSAGSQPAGEVFAGTITALHRHGIDTRNLQSQSWDEFEAFAPDLVITVCDNAAAEACPLWIGEGAKVHWGLADPSKLPAGQEQDEAFDRLIETLTCRIEKLLGLLAANSGLQPASLKAAVAALAE